MKGGAECTDLKDDAPERFPAQRAGARSHLEAGHDAGLDAVPQPVKRVRVQALVRRADDAGWGSGVADGMPAASHLGSQHRERRFIARLAHCSRLHMHYALNSHAN